MIDIYKKLDGFWNGIKHKKGIGKGRPMVQHLKQRNNGKMLLGAEIGVFQGYHALHMLNELNISKLYLIDPYVPYIENEIEINYSDCLNIARKVLSKHNDKIQWLKDYSFNVANLFNDNQLDFVYIDGNHSYKNVKQDMSRRGGLII